ncbi:MAG: hypothetical protein PHW62_01635 [Candidatus Ratteibacteria bacterium]|nr:hypothetical protein [Candidatus Ratteibacteria bacterium]
MPQPDEEQEEYEEPLTTNSRNSEAQQESDGEQQTHNDVIYNNVEEEQKRDEMAYLFFTLATQISKSDEKIKELMAHTITIKQKIYFRLTAGEEEDFLKALETVNQNLGKAQTMLDTYVELDKSQPEFKNFYNKFYYLFESINAHRESIFYIYNATQDEFLYPLHNIKTKFGGLSFLFARLCGVLNTSGNYIRHVLYLSPRSIPTSSEGYPGGGYIGGYGGGSGYYPQPNRGIYNDDPSLINRREPKRETRDIGDRDDTK